MKWLFCSYNADTDTCHVPHDDTVARTTMLGLNGIAAEGFTSYFMEEETIPVFSEEHSGTGVIYWRTAETDLNDNVRLLGINTLAECHVACQLSTDGICWVFR